MRLAIWTYTGSLAFASLVVVAVGGLLSNIHDHKLGHMPLPRLTEFVEAYHLWAWGVPIPWLAAALWLSRRDAATPPRVMAFAGVSTLAVTVLFACTTLAAFLLFVTAFRLQ